jgi:glucose-1-phosphate cytidylyltransferase
MKTIILCGGRGMRLQEETEFRPKPLIPVGGRPILWHIMKTYAHYGFREFLLCLGYRGDMIKEYFLNYEAMSNDFTIRLGQGHSIAYDQTHGEQDFRVSLADTGLETMTGGRVKRVEKYLEEDTFMVTYGDGVADINLKALVDFHRQHGRLATLTVVHPFSRFGIVTLDANSAVLHFAEKPQVDEWVNAGFFVFNRRVFDYLGGDDCILEREPLERLAHEGQLMAYRHQGFFYAMDTYRDYRFLNELWDSGKTPWKVWE